MMERSKEPSIHGDGALLSSPRQDSRRPHLEPTGKQAGNRGQVIPGERGGHALDIQSRHTAILQGKNEESCQFLVMDKVKNNLARISTFPNLIFVFLRGITDV